MVESSNQEIILTPANNDKKYTVKIGNKHISFGAKNMSDFTIHKNEARR